MLVYMVSIWNILWCPSKFYSRSNIFNLHFQFQTYNHFEDDTNLLNYNNNSVNRMNKQSNQDLGNLTNWVNANKICLNINKTEVFLFKSSRKLTNVPLKMKLNGKRLCPTNS